MLLGSLAASAAADAMPKPPKPTPFVALPRFAGKEDAPRAMSERAASLWAHPGIAPPPPSPPPPAAPARIAERRAPPPAPYRVEYGCLVQRNLTSFPTRRRRTLAISYFESMHDVGEGPFEKCEAKDGELACQGAKHPERAKDYEAELRRHLCNIEAHTQSVHFFNPEATAVLLTTERQFLGDVETHSAVDVEVVRVGDDVLGLKEGKEKGKDPRRPFRALLSYLEAHLKESHEPDGVDVIFTVGTDYLVSGQFVEPFKSHGAWRIAFTYSPVGDQHFHPEVMYMKALKWGESNGHGRNIEALHFLRDAIQRFDRLPAKYQTQHSRWVEAITEGMEGGNKGMKNAIAQQNIKGTHLIFSRQYLFVDQNPQGEDWGVLRGMFKPPTHLHVLFLPTQLFNCRAGFTSEETVLVRFQDGDHDAMVSAWDLLSTGQATVAANQTEPGRRDGLDKYSGRQVYVGEGHQGRYSLANTQRTGMEQVDENKVYYNRKRQTRDAKFKVLTVTANTVRTAMDKHHAEGHHPDSLPEGISVGTRAHDRNVISFATGGAVGYDQTAIEKSGKYGATKHKHLAMLKARHGEVNKGHIKDMQRKRKWAIDEEERAAQQEVDAQRTEASIMQDKLFQGHGF